MSGSKDLPLGWQWTTLGFIADVRLGKMLSPAAYANELDQLPYLRNENVRWGRLDLSDVKSMGFKPTEIERYAVKPGDLLICEGGEPGRCAVYSGPAGAYMYQKALHRVRPESTDVSVFYLQAVLQYYASSGTGFPRASETTIQHLPLEKMLSLPVPLAPGLEQRRIVAAIEEQFTRLDAAVALLERARANLRRHRTGVLAAATTGRLVSLEADLALAEHRTYESGDELLSRVLRERAAVGEKIGIQARANATESSLPPLPTGWAWARLPRLGRIERGRSRHRPRDDPRLLGGPYPFIQTADVKRSGGFIRTHSQTYSEFGLAQSRLWPAGTLCITIAANIAETGILTYPACFPDSVVGFTAATALVNVRYIELFLRTARDRLARFAPATAQ